MIRFDAVAAWNMRERGWEPQEWLERLRRTDTGHHADGRAWASWRQLPDVAPAGQWFSRMELVVSEDGEGHVTFDPVQIGTARYMQESTDGKGPRSGALMLPGHMPETLLAALSGRRVDTLVDFAPLAATTIVEAQNVTIATMRCTVVAVEPVREDVATPGCLMP